MTDTVRNTTGGPPQRFTWSLPGIIPQVNFISTTGGSQPIPKDSTFSTYVAAVKGSAGAQTATVLVQATNDPHTAGADDPVAGTRNNFFISTLSGSPTITSAEGLFRSDMTGDEVYAQGVALGTTMTFVSKTTATLSANATATAIVPARFQSFQWVLLATITLSGTLQAADGFATISNWKWVRANVTAITGTGASVVCTQGV